MAYDKVVDSSQLNSDLTSVANAIRTKGGTSAQLTFPAGFVSAIGNIKTSGLELYATLIRFKGTDFITAGVPDVVLVSNNSNGLSLIDSFNSTKAKTIFISAPTITSPHYGFMNNNEVETITFNSGTGYVTGEFQSAFHNCSKLKYVLGSELDMSTSSNTNTFYQAAALEEIRIKNNTIKNVALWSLSSCPNLSDASIISFANGLNDQTTGKAFSCHNTVKAKLDIIVGVVNNGVFEADPNGTIILRDFITNTKGWSIA